MAHYTLTDFHDFLGRPFSDLSVLEKALTAPGAEGDKGGNPDERVKYEGNRILAQIGTPLHQLAVKRLVLNGVPRGRADDILKSSFAKLEERAKSIGFFDIIKPNPRQRGFVSQNTLRLVFSAIVGAVHENCGRVESITTDVVNRLYFNPLPGLKSYHTTSLSELEISPGPGSWDDLIDIPETPPSTHSETIDTPTSDNLYNGWQHETVVTPSSQLDVLQPDFEAPEDTVDPMGYTTPQSMDIDGYHSLLDNRMQIAAGENEGPTLNESDEDMISETTNASAPAPRTDTHQPACKVIACVKRSEQQIDPVSTSSRLGKRSSQKISSEPLEKYIVLEKKRRVDTGSTFLETDFNLSILKARVHPSKVELQASALFILYFGIGSPEALATLQSLLKTRRERSIAQQCREKNDLSPAERMVAIERADANVAYFSLRKRCHVYQLYLDCSSESLRASDTFVTSTVKTMATRRKSQIGNPHNLEISRVSNRMLTLSYPNLRPDDPSYGQKRNYINALRRLGQHIHLLVESFGYGILGLIPLPSNEPTFVNLTNEAILQIRDSAFKPLVDYINERFGSVLRETSEAVKGVVEAIFNEETDPADVFAIERCEQAQIIQYPRGSPELLRLISEKS